MTRGRVVAVDEILAGTCLEADAQIDDTALTVGDVYDFDEEGGTLVLLAEDGTTETVAYTAIDDEAETIALATGIVAAYEAGSEVRVEPPAPERYAHVVPDDDPDDVLYVRVPHYLFDLIPVGSRDPDDQESVRIDLEGDGSPYIADVYGATPIIDGSYIDPDTLPPPADSDGNPPGSSPTPSVLAMIGALFASWAGITNADPVTYEVHLSTSTGFTPSGSTLVGETGATRMVIRADNAGSPLAYGTDYYVKIIAKDADGSASPSNQAGPTQTAQVNSADIIAAAIIADKIAAGAISAEKLEAVLVLASAIATAASGARVVLDTDGLTCYDGSDNQTGRFGADGNVSLRGEIAATGGTIEGTLRGGTLIGPTYKTADTGRRLEIAPGVSSPTTVEGSSFSDVVGTSTVVGTDRRLNAVNDVIGYALSGLSAGTPHQVSFYGYLTGWSIIPQGVTCTIVVRNTTDNQDVTTQDVLMVGPFTALLGRLSFNPVAGKSYSAWFKWKTAGASGVKPLLDKIERGDMGNLLNYYDADNARHPMMPAPTVKVYRTGTQSIPDATDREVTWQAEVEDPDDMWVAGNPTRITAAYKGWHLFLAQVAWAADVTGFRRCWISHSTGGRRGEVSQAGFGGAVNRQQVFTCENMSVGDYMEVLVRQNSGGPLALQDGVDDTWIACQYLGP